MNHNGDPTLAGTQDPRLRLRKLQDSRLNLQMNILDMLDKISIIEHEIAGLQA
jgi:hypothetical protein